MFKSGENVRFGDFGLIGAAVLALFLNAVTSAWCLTEAVVPAAYGRTAGVTSRFWMMDGPWPECGNALLLFVVMGVFLLGLFFLAGRIKGLLRRGPGFLGRHRRARKGGAAPCGNLLFPKGEGLAGGAENRLLLFKGLFSGWRIKPAALKNSQEARRMLEKALRAGGRYPLVVLDAAKGGGRKGPVDVGSLWKGREKGFSLLPRPSQRGERPRAVMLIFDKSAIQAGEGPAASRSLRVLVAEDSFVHQRLTTLMLLRRGHRAASVYNGEEVLRALARQDFDLVLMDVQMPLMDGFEATAVIRQHEEETGGPRLPIIAMAGPEEGERCLAAGMDGFIYKPVKFDELLAVIEQWEDLSDCDGQV